MSKRKIGQAGEVEILEVSEECFQEIMVKLAGLGREDRFVPRYIKQGDMHGIAIDMHGIVLGLADKDRIP